jgi:hypothetical protein
MLHDYDVVLPDFLSRTENVVFEFFLVLSVVELQKIHRTSLCRYRLSNKYLEPSAVDVCQARPLYSREVRGSNPWPDCIVERGFFSEVFLI